MARPDVISLLARQVVPGDRVRLSLHQDESWVGITESRPGPWIDFVVLDYEVLGSPYRGGTLLLPGDFHLAVARRRTGDASGPNLDLVGSPPAHVPEGGEPVGLGEVAAPAAPPGTDDPGESDLLPWVVLVVTGYEGGEPIVRAFGTHNKGQALRVADVGVACRRPTFLIDLQPRTDGSVRIDRRDS